MKEFILTLLIIALAGTLMADVHSAAGEYGYKFLNIPVSPASIAWAGRGINYEANQAAWLWQPAIASAYSRKSVSASHSTWIGDTAYTSLVYSFSQRCSHFGLALINLDYGELENRDETGALIGYYNPADINIRGNYARRVSPNLYLGMNLGVIYEKLDTASSLGLSTDLGGSWLPPLHDSKLSVALRNLGFSNKTESENIKLPLSMDLDLYKGLALGNQHLGLEASLGKSLDEDVRLTLSTELALLDIISLRAGYKFNTDAEGLSAGLGIRFSRFAVDYGFAAFNEGLDDIHSFGLSYHF
ncbi:MAG: hypothetical protein PWP64_1292 [Candidatus Cloacimonadota bacterium]|nr:hypothetical protein [Candidatus Cloacimonadota bacterium]